MDYIYQLFLAFIGSLGFGLVFKINLNKVFLASCGGIICWAVYLVCGKMIGMSIFGASFVATAVSAVYAEYLAKYLHCPSIIMYITALIPLIPGSGLYYTMNSIVHEQWLQAQNFCYTTIQCALGIALGISFVYTLVQIRKRI